MSMGIGHFALGAGAATGVLMVTGLDKKIKNTEPIRVAGGIFALLPDIGKLFPYFERFHNEWFVDFFWGHKFLDAKIDPTDSAWISTWLIAFMLIMFAIYWLRKRKARPQGGLFVFTDFCDNLISNMINKKDFHKISDWLWEIPKSFRQDMKVPARAYVSEEMLEDAFRDRSLEQLVNIATLPGVVNYSMAMPDMHEGYGFPIGGVAAMSTVEGVISPGGVGYDINCGMKFLKSDYSAEDLKPHLDKLAGEIQKEVPSGLGKGRQIKLSIAEIDKILEGGAKKLVEQGYGEPEDLINCESGGNLPQADASLVSDHAKDRGRDQVGTLGSGNHFLEIQKVAEIFDEGVAKTFGLFKDRVVVMIHTGSRGLGHQIATDYIRVMMQAMPKYGIRLPDRELAACPINSIEGKRYFSAMCAGANYAWANRQMIAHFVRKAWASVLGEKASGLEVLYDVAHNIAKIENHIVGGKETELCLHRKGATRAFPGQPVIIPGSMGTASYILVGQESGRQSWFSTCHGAGRMMSRHEAMRRVSGEQVVRELEKQGIIVKCWSYRGIAEEAPLAYKDVNSVVDVVHNAGLSRKVAKLVPLAVIKGE